MVNVCLSIAPVGVLHLVAAERSNRLVVLNHLAATTLSLRPPNALKGGSTGGREFHLVWVDDAVLFLSIKGILVALSMMHGFVSRVTLFVVGEETIGVGVAHKTIYDAGVTVATVSIASGQLSDCGVRQ